MKQLSPVSIVVFVIFGVATVSVQAATFQRILPLNETNQRPFQEMELRVSGAWKIQR